ncbi:MULTISPECIES: PA0069 family radical SAM protein [unclassified Duganella]|uniref:PA0069 family radical SAM protein n=1 Tax=unclassified Duganella TaxID=2636909 RepID=UPI0008845187|nr:MULTISPECIES: PA0069 family radical SAM protein [unclassified Duganella]SDF46460.1 DNA repair photolyase [Duganella sp. OV458]SDI80323.1 DNA repair photolyase [Duganella sp. OV510]
MSHDENNQEHVMLPPPSLKAQKGRGAVSNMQGRYELNAREAYDDGWEREEEEVKPWKTHVTEELCKSILSRNASPDLPFSVSLNPYRGCEHGCIYCFARPTHSYLGLSPGMDFESKIFAKVNAPEVLRRELAKPSYQPESIALGVNTDAYQPCEREYKLTRRVLEVLQECQHPVGLITKNSLIERDIDILAPMAARRQAGVAITLTTLDPAIARTLEPRAAAPARRLRTIRTLTDAGIPVAVSIAPIIPFITEPDIERILEAVKEAGAVSVHYTVLRLPWEVAPLFKEWLQAHFPERAQRVMNRVREMRGGKDYDSNFDTRMKGEGVWAELIRQRVKIASERLGLTGQGSRFHRMDASQFTRPLVVPPLGARAKAAADAGQMDLF